MRAWGPLIGLLGLAAAVAGCDTVEPTSPAPTPAPSERAASPAADDPFDAAVSVEFGASGALRVVGVVLDRAGHVAAGLGADPEVGERATVTVPGGATVEADVVGADARTGVTVVRVSDPAGLVPATLGDRDAVAAGDEVVVAAMPDGPVVEPVPGTVRDPGVAVGTVGMIEIDVAPIGGGMVATDEGAALGLIVSASAAAGGGTVAGYALPVDLVVRVADQLIAGESPTHPYLGMGVDEASGGGVVVRQVVPGGPAERAGLRTGDVVTALDGRAVEDPGDLLTVVQSAEVGQEIAVAYNRDGAAREADVTVTAAPD